MPNYLPTTIDRYDLVVTSDTAFTAKLFCAAEIIITFLNLNQKETFLPKKQS
jgi:hypothetical protein